MQWILIWAMSACETRKRGVVICLNLLVNMCCGAMSQNGQWTCVLLVDDSIGSNTQ